MRAKQGEASERGNPGGQTNWEEDQELSDRQEGTTAGAQQARARLKPWVHSGRRMSSLSYKMNLREAWVT